MYEATDGDIDAIANVISNALKEKYGEACGHVLLVFNDSGMSLAAHGPVDDVLGALQESFAFLANRHPKAADLIIKKTAERFGPKSFKETVQKISKLVGEEH